MMKPVKSDSHVAEFKCDVCGSVAYAETTGDNVPCEMCEAREQNRFVLFNIRNTKDTRIFSSQSEAYVYAARRCADAIMAEIGGGNTIDRDALKQNYYTELNLNGKPAGGWCVLPESGYLALKKEFGKGE